MEDGADLEADEQQVEFGSEEDEGSQDIDLSSFNQAVLWGTDWTVETVIAQLKRGNIEINPRFQRRDAWTRITKSRFIESVILGLPVPQVVLAELADQRGRYIILDGKQRLLSLMQFAGIASESKNNGFRLRGLEARKDMNRKSFKDLEKDPNLQNDLSAFLTHTIRAVVIRNWPSLTFLHIVFQRLNTGSLKLSPQELRQALAPGEFTYFADDQTIGSTEIQKLLGRSGPDPRMRDVELLVRFIAFRIFLSQYAGRMKEFLDQACLDLNQQWAKFKERIELETAAFKAGIAALEEIFSISKIARKKNSQLFNRSIFDTLIFYACDPLIRDSMIVNKNAVIKAYSKLIDDEQFQAAVESDTAGLPHTSDRLVIWGNLLSEAINTAIAVPRTEKRPSGEIRFAP